MSATGPDVAAAAGRLDLRGGRHRLLIIGYYIWELVTPYNLRRELQENKNLAVAVVVAAFILGMAIVIAAALILIK